MSKEYTEETNAAQEAELEDLFDEYAGKNGADDFDDDDDSDAVGAGAAAAGDEDTPSSKKVAPTPNELEELRRQNQELLHKTKSDSGRLSVLQRQLNELQSANRQPQTQDLVRALKDPQKWAEVRDDYPDLASGIEDIINSRFEAIRGEVRQQVEPLRQKAYQGFKQEQYDLLSLPKEQGGYGHADYREMATSAEFKEWVRHQPPQVQQLMTSDSAADAAYLLTTFKALNGGRSTVQTNNAGAGIVESRRQRLSMAQETPTQRRAVSGAGAEDDSEALFNHYAKQYERRLRR